MKTRIRTKKVLAQVEHAKALKMPRVRIHVSTQTIKRATTCNTNYCMIAEAIKECVPGASAVSVDLQTIRWTDRKARVRYVFLTPPPAQAALLQFDNGVRPRAFNINLRSGQIIPTRRRRITEAKQAASKTKTKTKRTKARRSTAAKLKVIAGKSEGVAMIIGGQAPPKATLGNRRIFGLNASHLERALA